VKLFTLPMLTHTITRENPPPQSSTKYQDSIEPPGCLEGGLTKSPTEFRGQKRHF
jgi:hypothetical protein